jgi:Flp pilus assembly protein TadG
MRLPFLSRIRSRFRELVGADSGQVAITFGLALIPMVLAIGCGVDISRAIAARSSLVNALDATALAVARMPLSSSVAQTNTAEMTKVAHAYFYANHAGSDVGTVTSLGIAPATSGQGWLFTATARVPTAFMSLAGFDFVEVDATTEVMREARALEMALVLDTTASMQGPRISALRTAAESLVNSVAVDPSVRLAVVPFAQYVNIGTANRSIPGVSVPSNSTTCTTTNRSVTTCTGTEQYQTTCTRQINPRPGTCTVDGAQVPCTIYDTESYPCTRTRGTGCTTTTQPVETCTSQTWYGCVGSRPPPLNASDLQFPSSPLPGVMNVRCSRPVLTLTSSVTALRSAITALTVSGNTYIPAGLQVGWHVLSPRIPFTEGTPYSTTPQPRRVMLLMTDGTNSLSLSGQGPLHTGTSRTAADQLTRDLCTKIKQDNIDLYAIAFEVTDASTKQMLQECSSGGGYFFDASDSTQLIKAFEAIAVGVSNLRISK